MTSPPSSTGATDGALSNVSILVVEDSWFVARAHCMLLESAGAVVVGPAATCDHALQLVETQRIDLAVVDVDLGGRTSLVLIDRLCERGIPTVVVTGYSSLPNLDDRAAIVLEKPVKAEKLVAVVGRQLLEAGHSQ